MIKIVLTGMLTYYLTWFKFPKWAIKQIDRFRRGFFWKGHDLARIKGGHYLINWKTCTTPKKLGGLGFKDLEKFNRALRLRWLWHQWDSTTKPWKNLLKWQDVTEK